MPDIFPDLARDFAIALLLGALVGIEREKKKQAGGAAAAGGLRTFILLAEAGALSAWLTRQLATPWIFIGFGALVAAIVTVGYVFEVRQRPESIGITTEIASLVVFLLGGTVVFGHRELAIALGIATSAVLAFKEPLHQVARRLGADDIFAGVKLLIATFIVLPLLPAHAIDPWGALNPHQLWWLVILISGLSLCGYVAMRWLGPERGTVLTGVFGGLVSSTAVTLTFARRSRGEPEIVRALATGVLLAWSVMFTRVLVMVAVVERSLLPRLLAPMGAMLALTLAVAVTSNLRGRGAPAVAHAGEQVKLTNPFSLTAAARFGLFFAAIQLVVKLAGIYLPSSGLYLVAALAGATDVDAITLSMANSVKQGTSAEVAAGAILVAALSNSLVKCGITLALGAAALRAWVSLATVAAGLGAAAAWMLR